MRKVLRYSGLSLVDIATQEHGGVEGLLSLAKLNGYAMDASLATDSVLIIDEAVESVVRAARKLFPRKPLAIADVATVQNGQNIADLCIQEYGGIEGILSLLKLNGLTATDDPVNGTNLKIDLTRISNASVRSYFKARKQKVNTFALPVDDGAILAEDGFCILSEDGFKLLEEI